MYHPTRRCASGCQWRFSPSFPLRESGPAKCGNIQLIWSVARRQRVLVCLPNLHSSSMSKIRAYPNSAATKSTERKCSTQIPYYTSHNQYVGSSVQVYGNSLNSVLLSRFTFQNVLAWHTDRQIFKILEKASKISFDSLLKLLLSRNVTNASRASMVSMEEETPASGNVFRCDILQNCPISISHVANDGSIREMLPELWDLFNIHVIRASHQECSYSSNSMERNDTEEIRCKAYETL